MQSLVSAQSKTPAQSKVGSTPAGKTPNGPAVIARRSVRNTGPTIPLIEKDFAEAVRVIQENYIESQKLDYNAVFKSSIIGMLRSLDPHSNYYDRDEYDELRTEQR